MVELKISRVTMRFYAFRRKLPSFISSRGGSVIPGLLDFFERHQVGGFQETAKILLADMVAGSCAGGEALDGLVFHFQALQVQDTKIFLTAFPDLILLQLHRHHYTNRVRALATRLLWKE